MFDFLKIKPQAFGLDISDRSLKIAKLERKKQGFALVSFLERRIEPGIIEKGEIRRPEALTKIIKDSVAKAKGKPLETRYVVASLPEEKAFLQVIPMPLLKMEELKEAIRFEAENYIPLPLHEMYLDFRVVRPLYDHLDHLDVLIAALPKKTIDPYVSCLKNAGLVPLALEIESEAISRALVKNGVSSSPLLLIDIGLTRTSFIIFSGHSLRFTSSIPISSAKFTKAIAKSLKLDPKSAEKLKIRYGLGGPKAVHLKGKRVDGLAFKKEILQEGKALKALTPVLEEFKGEIKKYIDYYKSHDSNEHLPSDGKGVAKILLCGGGANLKGLCQLLSSGLGLPVKLANPWVNILAEGEKETPEISFKKSLAFTTALGLALRGT